MNGFFRRSFFLFFFFFLFFPLFMVLFDTFAFLGRLFPL